VTTPLYKVLHLPLHWGSLFSYQTSLHQPDGPKGEEHAADLEE